MDTRVVTLIPALLAPLAGTVPGFPVHGRLTVSAATAALFARAVSTIGGRPAG